MKKKRNYIWLFGENEGNTANNNSFYFWKKSINIKDEIDKYFVLKKDKKNKKIYNDLTVYEKKYILWKNSISHFQKYHDADMFFVSLSYKDITPNKIGVKKLKYKIKKPLIYLQHGTLGIKKLDYTGQFYNNNMFRFCIYNQKIKDIYKKENDFKDYQLYVSKYHPRYIELVKKEEKYKNKNQILWFITWREYFSNNSETELFVKYIERVVSSPKLKDYLKKNNMIFKICLHSFFDKKVLKQVYKYVDEKYIQISTPSNVDVMDELAKSKLLITDYSSVGFDFTFLKKPVLLFQPDRNIYLKKRKLYCDIEELKENCVAGTSKLIDAIIDEKYQLNQFFEKRLPQKIDYEYVREGKHIIESYNYFANMQKNKITFLGYNYYGVGGTVNATISLAEGLLEQGYLVELLSLKKIRTLREFPYGLNIQYLYYLKTKSFRKKIEKTFHNSKKHYSYLNYDGNKKQIIPYGGYLLKKELKQIKTNTIVSTRESFHLFVENCENEMIKNKLYFFHAAGSSFEKLFPNLMPILKQNTFEKAIFVTEKNRNDLIEKFDFNNYKKHLILGNAIEQANMIDINDISAIKEKKIYNAIYMLRINKDRTKDIDNLIKFGQFIKEHKINNIVIDVFGAGNYVNEFMDAIDRNDLCEIINYCGLTIEPSKEIRNHDFMIDLSLNHSFGMTYIEAILNGKKVFCMKNKGSEEVMENIPNSYIISFEWLCKEIKNIYKITESELKENYRKIQKKYAREIITKKFIKFIK